MKYADSYLWSDVSEAGPFGTFTEGLRVGDWSAVFARTLPAASAADAFAHLAADAEWSAHLGPAIAVAPAASPVPEPIPALVLLPSGFRPLSRRPHGPCPSPKPSNSDWP